MAIDASACDSGNEESTIIWGRHDWWTPVIDVVRRQSGLVVLLPSPMVTMKTRGAVSEAWARNGARVGQKTTLAADEGGVGSISCLSSDHRESRDDIQIDVSPLLRTRDGRNGLCQ